MDRTTESDDDCDLLGSINKNLSNLHAELPVLIVDINILVYVAHNIHGFNNLYSCSN